MTFRDIILTHIENEKKIIEENKKDPCRYTEFGNQLCMQRISDHKLKLEAYEELLKEYDINEGLRSSVTMYYPVDGVSDEERMRELALVAVKGDVYKKWKWNGDKWEEA